MTDYTPEQQKWIDGRPGGYNSDGDAILTIIGRLERERDKLTAELAETRDELQQSREEHTETAADLADLRREADGCRDCRKEADIARDAAIADRNGLAAVCRSYEERLCSAGRAWDGAIKERNGLRDQLATFHRERDELQKTCSKLGAKSVAAHHALDVCTRQRIVAESECGNLADQLAALKREPARNTAPEPSVPISRIRIMSRACRLRYWELYREDAANAACSAVAAVTLDRLVDGLPLDEPLREES